MKGSVFFTVIFMVLNVHQAHAVDNASGARRYRNETQEQAELRQSLIERNQELTHQAIKHLREGQIIKVDEVSGSECGGTSARYTIGKKKNVLNLTTELKLIPDNKTIKDQRAYEKAVAKVRACIPMAQELFSRYGIQFNVVLSSKASATKLAHPVVLADEAGRSDAGFYYLKQDEMWEQASPGDNIGVCEMVTHEVAHSLGLADEYTYGHPCVTEKSAASNDEFPISLMKMHEVLGPELHPRHIKSILTPVYDDATINSTIKSTPEGSEMKMIIESDLKMMGDAPWTYIAIKDKHGISECKIQTTISYKDELKAIPGPQTLTLIATSASIEKIFRNQDGHIEKEFKVTLKATGGHSQLKDVQCTYWSRTNDLTDLESKLNEALKDKK